MNKTFKIVTIIVLLILTGIILNMIIGKDGIFRKASTSENKTLTNKIEASYIVKSTNGNNMEILVMFFSDKGIDKITRPDGIEITPINKNKIAIDYTVTSNTNYTFKAQKSGESENEEYVLKATLDSKIKVTESSSEDLYPVLTENGVEAPFQKVKISSENSGKIYYSIDNTTDWQEYKDEIKISKDCKVYAKYISNEENEITKIETKDITYKIASDIIGEKAYDGLEETYEEHGEGDQVEYINVDKSAWNKVIYINYTQYGRDDIGCATIKFMYKNTILKTYTLEKQGTYKDYVYIPENTTKIQYKKGFRSAHDKIYEMQINKVLPNVEFVTKYPTLTAKGIVDDGIKIKLKYNTNTSAIKYKMNNMDWTDYTKDQIIEVGSKQTISLKGIDSNNKEYESTYTAPVSIGKEAFDGDESTSSRLGGYGFMNVKPEVWNKQLNILGEGYRIIELLDEEGNSLYYIEHGSFDDKNTDTITVLENTAFLRIYRWLYL